MIIEIIEIGIITNAEVINNTVIVDRTTKKTTIDNKDPKINNNITEETGQQI